MVGLSSNYFFNIFVDESAYLLSIPKDLFGFYGLLLGYFSLWLINFIFKIFSKKDGIGGGDFILFGAIGSIFGPISLPIILFIGSLFGCLMYIFLNNASKKEIPLGSCLILGSFAYFVIKKFELFNHLLVL
jgi:leader peptidase (prepilin peptidase)/N-methyltransferase